MIYSFTQAGATAALTFLLFLQQGSSEWMNT